MKKIENEEILKQHEKLLIKLLNRNLKRKDCNLRCPVCKEDRVYKISSSFIIEHISKEDVKEINHFFNKSGVHYQRNNYDFYLEAKIQPWKILGLRHEKNSFYCFNCKEMRKEIINLAMVDGIFLDQNKDLKKRSERYVEELCKELDFRASWSGIDNRTLSEDEIRNQVKERALKILIDFNNKWGIRSYAGACVYIASIIEGRHKTQAEICCIMKNCPSSLRVAYKEIAQKVEIDIVL